MLLVPVLLLGFTMAGAAPPPAPSARPGGDPIAVTGRVLDAPDGRPLAGAEVTLEPILPRQARDLAERGLREAGPPVATARTGSGGRYRLAAPHFGAWQVVVRIPGRVPMTRELVPLLGPVELAPVAPPRDQGLTVAIADPEGRAARGARALLVTDTGDGVWRSLRDTGWKPVRRHRTAGPEGRIRLPLADGERPLLALAPAGGALAGPVELSAQALARRHAEVRLPDAPQPPSEAPAEARATAFTVVGFLAVPGGDALPRGLVWADTDPGAARGVASDGRFRLTIPAGGRWLTAAAPGFLPRVVPLDTLEAGRAHRIELEPAQVLSGRAVDERDQPVAGARVEVSLPPLPPGVPARLREDRPPIAWTGSDGRFFLGLLPRQARYELTATRPGHVPATVSAASEEDDLEVLLRRDHAAFGRVVDTTGAPLEGARIGMRPELPTGARIAATETDREGLFELAGLAPGAWQLVVRHPDHGPVRVPGLRIPEEPGRRDLGTVRLPPPALVTGRVVDPWGAPVAGARVSAAEAAVDGGSKLPLVGAETAGDGAFTLKGLEPGARIDLRVEAEGFSRAALTSLEVPPATPVEVILQPGYRLAGKVVDEAGSAVAGARVQASSEAAEGPPPETRTDRAGRFTLEGLPPGRYRVTGRAAGFVPSSEAGVPVGEEETPELELVLRSGATVMGRVVDAQGAPLPGARVTLAGGEAAAPTTAPGRRAAAESDPGGRFRLDGLEPGLRLLEVRHEEHLPARREVRLDPGENRITLVLERGAVVAGRVVDPAGAPVAGARVALELPAAAPPEVNAGPDGSFRFRGVTPGRATLSATRSGWAPALLEAIEVTPAGVEGLELVLEPEVVISGRILGAALPDLVRLELTATDLVRSTLSGVVDHAGHYQIRGASPGEWWVMAELPDGRSAEGRVEILGGDREVRLDLELAGEEILRGRVLLGGEPIAGAEVSLGPPGGRPGVPVLTGHRGGFELATDERGLSLLYVESARHGISHQEEVLVDGGREVVVDLPAAGVAGTVVDAGSGALVAGAVVILEGAAGTGRRTRSDADGAFVVEPLHAGPWSVRAEAPGFSPTELTVELAAGERLEGLQVSLDAAAGLELDVRTAEGTAPARVHAALLDGTGRRVAGGTYAVDGRGRVRLEEAPAGRWRLLVAADETATAEETVEIPGAAVAIRLPAAGTLEIRLSETTEAHALVHVTALAPGGRPIPVVRPGGGVDLEHPALLGRSRIQGLPAGNCTLRAVASDGTTWAAPATVFPGSSTAVTLEPRLGGAP